MYMPGACVGWMKAWNLETGVVDGREASCRCWELNPGP